MRALPPLHHHLRPSVPPCERLGQVLGRVDDGGAGDEELLPPQLLRSSRGAVVGVAAAVLVDQIRTVRVGHDDVSVPQVDKGWVVLVRTHQLPAEILISREEEHPTLNDLGNQLFPGPVIAHVPVLPHPVSLREDRVHPQADPHPTLRSSIESRGVAFPLGEGAGPQLMVTAGVQVGLVKAQRLQHKLSRGLQPLAGGRGGGAHAGRQVPHHGAFEAAEQLVTAMKVGEEDLDLVVVAVNYLDHLVAGDQPDLLHVELRRHRPGGPLVADQGEKANQVEVFSSSRPLQDDVSKQLATPTPPL
mmetsp:Transcript_4187/g.15431  ORF Transcript_4187/g.15431 Transcript_4187/m.15431 type:complete len:302 (+) Transcript_4187:303-1208(+)